VAGRTVRVEEANPAQCEFADTKNCRVYGSLEFRPDALPKLDFHLDVDGQARLDPWITGWGEQLRTVVDGKPLIPPPPEPGAPERKFEMTTQITARSTLYKGQSAGRLNATINYTFDRNGPRVTQFSRVRLEGFGGSLEASGRLISKPWDPANSPLWTADATVTTMRIYPLLTCLFRDPANVDGFITTKLKLDGVGTDMQRLRGSGWADMTDVILSKSPVIRRVGEITRQSFEGRQFETASSTDFRIGNGAVSTRNLQFQSKGIALDFRGRYYFDRRIEGMIRLGLLETVASRLPLPVLPELARFVDKVAGKLLLAFRISGPASNPRIEPVPAPLFLGMDQIDAP
jgi:hypothetical protein